MAHTVRFRRESQTEFHKSFRTLTDRHNSWEVWADFINLAAITIFMPFGNQDDQKHQEREAEFNCIMKRYSEKERPVFAELFAQTVQALEDEPEQDFLGEMFMLLELSNHWKGQFFTPYDVCKMMAIMSLQEVGGHIAAKGWIGINDPACGGGALLIAVRNSIYLASPPVCTLAAHQQVLFVAQDIDRTAALMCYIQLSLLGCAGYVIVGDSLLRPNIGLNGNPVLPVETEGQDIWCMPLFHDQVWVYRQLFASIEAFTKPSKAPASADVSQHREYTETAGNATPGRRTARKRAAARKETAKASSKPPENAYAETSSGQLTLF